MASNDFQFFKLGEIRPALESDFQYFIELADGAGWTKKVDKNGMAAWMRNMGKTSIKMLKLRTTFTDVSAATAFDVLMDGEFRSMWDESALRDYDICRLDGCNDIGYYAVKCPAPLKNRDFVNQRSWRVSAQDYIVFNHSISHEKEPPTKSFVRAVSYVTGFLIRASGEGSVLTYITQSDPKGRIPNWAINFGLYQLAPRVIRKLHAACVKYNSWKEAHKPEFKPWLNPDQNPLPLLTSEEVVTASSAEAVASLVSEEDEGVSGQDLETAPKGLEQYQTMDTEEEAVVVNGVSFDTT